MDLKIIVLISILAFLMVSITNAQLIKINISELLGGNITVLSYDPIIKNVFKVNMEFFNSGSVGYKARTRLDIFNGSDLIFIGWSREKSLPPGARKNFEIYWYHPNITGKFSGKIRIYYANEIKESDINFKIENMTIPTDIFEISDLRTYDDHIKFALKSSRSVNNVVAFASNYPLGWIFEQEEITEIAKNDKIAVTIPYEAALWEESSMTVSVVTEDGKYYTSKSFTMEKERGLTKYINYLVDYLRVLLNI